MKFFKVINILMFTSMLSGFTLLSDANWDISHTDPTLWVKMCNDTATKNFTNDLNNSADELVGINTVTGARALTSVINDINNVNSAYIRLATYPADPNNPGTPATGDSTFTIAKAATRTIEVCISSAGGVFNGGVAQPTFEGGRFTACTIKISEGNAESLKNFLGTLTHEIGHCLNLDHPMETTHSVMSYFRRNDDYRLMIDDKMALVHLYPNPSVDVKEKNSFGLSCSKN